MKRNWYAVIILAMLLLGLTGAGRYVRTTIGQIASGLQQAYACTQVQDYNGAVQAYRATAQLAQQHSPALLFLVRRNLLDQLNQTLATLPAYANPDNQADLGVETARASRQVQQLAQSFLGCF